VVSEVAEKSARYYRISTEEQPELLGPPLDLGDAPDLAGVILEVGNHPSAFARPTLVTHSFNRTKHRLAAIMSPRGYLSLREGEPDVKFVFTPLNESDVIDNVNLITKTAVPCRALASFLLALDSSYAPVNPP
jgi:hypothetical protein